MLPSTQHTRKHTHTHQNVCRRCLTHQCDISDWRRCGQRDRWFGRGPCGYEGRGQASITDSLCTWLSRQVCIKGRVLPRLPLVVVCVCLCWFVFVCAYVRVCACAYVCVHVCIYVRVLESVCARARACERARSRARRYNRPCVHHSYLVTGSSSQFRAQWATVIGFTQPS